MPHEIDRHMTEADFAEAQHFAHRNALPLRRVELMLARLTAEVAAGRGVENVSPADFLIKMIPDDAPVITEVPSDFKPRGKRKKRA